MNTEDLFKIDYEGNTHGFRAWLAWDWEKSGFFPKSHSEENDRYTAIGFLWCKYGAEIIKHIIGEGHDSSIGEQPEVVSLLDQSSIVRQLGILHEQVQRLNAEIFWTKITRHGKGTISDQSRMTLLGRVNQLSSLAGLLWVFID